MDDWRDGRWIVHAIVMPNRSSMDHVCILIWANLWTDRFVATSSSRLADNHPLNIPRCRSVCSRGGGRGGGPGEGRGIVGNLNLTLNNDYVPSTKRRCDDNGDLS